MLTRIGCGGEPTAGEVYDYATHLVVVVMKMNIASQGRGNARIVPEFNVITVSAA